MTALEIMIRLNSLNVELSHLENDAADRDNMDEVENLQAARDHISDAVDALRNMAAEPDHD